MSKLPILISMPHGGTVVPQEVKGLCCLSGEEILKDGDEGTFEIYSKLADLAQIVVKTEIARAIVDMNRAKDDFRKDGIIKTHTCWGVPVYKNPPVKTIIQRLIDHHHTPYHHELSEAAKTGVKLAIDCHTMADVGPPVGPDTGAERPMICLGNRQGETCPDNWLIDLAERFGQYFADVRINDPFAGGYIVAAHCREIPWIQLEISRTNTVSNNEKASVVATVIESWFHQL